MTGCTGNILKVASVSRVILRRDRQGRLFGNFLDDIYNTSLYDVDLSSLHDGNIAVCSSKKTEYESIAKQSYCNSTIFFISLTV